MKYLLDTNVIVDHLRGKKIIDQKVLEGGTGISVITLAELLYGAGRSQDPEKSLFKLGDFLEKLNLEAINLDEQIVFEFSKVKINLEKAGQRLEDFDLLIGATALTLNLTLVTGNLKHFQKIPQLKLFS